MNTTKARFFIYARKSTDDTSRQIRSIGDQLAEVKELAEREHLEIVEVFLEKQTAKVPGRPVFNEMLSRIEKGEANGILAWHPDRLARNSLDGGRVIYLVDTGKITDLRFPTFRFEPTAQGKFMLSIMFSQSKYYVDNLSENIIRGMRQKVKNGIWPQWAPTGYINDRCTRTIVPDPHNAPLIRRMFEMYATGSYTLKQIRTIFVELGLTGRLGKPVAVSKVHHALKNPIYYGMIRYKGELYAGRHEPIITQALFDKCQEILEAKCHTKKPATEKFPYRQLLRCGECGCYITEEKQKGHHYLRCTKKKGLCHQHYLREEEMSRQIAQAIKSVSLSDDWANWFLKEMDRQAAAEKYATHDQQAKLRDRISRYDTQLDQLLTLCLDQTLAADEYRNKKKKVLHERRKTQEMLDEVIIKRSSWLEPCKRFVRAANSAFELAQSNSLVKQRDFFKTVGSNLTLRDRRLGWEPRGAWQLIWNQEVTARKPKEAVVLAGANQGAGVQEEVKRRERDSNPR